MIDPGTLFVIGLSVAVAGVLLDLISTERAANRGFGLLTSRKFRTPTSPRHTAEVDDPRELDVRRAVRLSVHARRFLRGAK